MGFYSETVFPWLLDRVLGGEIEELRARTAACASGNVLEIGFGTGTSLPHYGPATKSLTALEPSPGMNRRAGRRIASARFPVKLVPASGEELPFQDATFDSVVMMITLCSVDDPRRVLGEVRRVLRSGGRYFFFEHVASERPGPRSWQERLNGVSRIIGVGCNLNRNTEETIRETGFRLEALDRLVSRAMPIPPLYPLIVGVGVRP